jgi:hypothetical protein
LAEQNKNAVQAYVNGIPQRSGFRMRAASAWDEKKPRRKRGFLQKPHHDVT